jgi:FkbH-like protein
MTQLYWLPTIQDWRDRLRRVGEAGDKAWDEIVALAGSRLDAVQTNALDTVMRRSFAEPPKALSEKPVRLAILGSSTLTHLLPAIRVAGLRRRMWVDVYENDYGQYWQELADPNSGLHRFKPNVVLLALDAQHLASGIGAGSSAADVEAALKGTGERIRNCWRLAREAFRCPVIHQLALPVQPPLLGSNEHRLAGSRAGFIAALNAELRRLADGEGVDVLALDARAARDGIAAWHNPELWHRAKQEVTPAAAPIYGDLVMRLVGAQRGRSYKALVMDLDNTIWGGVVGDDGVEGLVLGQGSALGEAFVQFQEYARELSSRGVILAVVSKNDEKNALEPFERHPEMALKRDDIASFVANWSDKPDNLRAVAEELNIGVDALVFIDDNPFERELVRRELPMVAVPEVTDDPTTYAQTLADAGYFEAVAIADEDRSRSGQYQGNRQRNVLKASATDLDSYLRGLEMRLMWRRFDRVGLNRTVQLINKTNQFNLTTRRYSEADVLGVMNDDRAFGAQLRLIDRFGDSGIIAIVVGRLVDEEDVLIDTWLMSCRVLGRQVEPTTLNLVAVLAREIGGRRLIGEYIPTTKNGMVKDHYRKLGFCPVDGAGANTLRYALDLTGFIPRETFVEVREERVND